MLKATDNKRYMSIKRGITMSLVFLISGVLCLAENKNDSIEKVLTNISNKTESLGEMEQYFKICQEFERNGDFIKALNNYLKLKEIAIQKNNQLLLTKCYLRIGLSYKNLSNYNEALSNFKNAQIIVERISNDSNFTKLYADVLNNIGSVFDDIANYDKAVEYYMKSIRVSESISDTIRILKPTMNTGASLFNMKKYDKAFEYYNKAYNLANLKNSKHNMAIGLYNIGTVFYTKENFSLALEYFEKSLKAFQEMNDKEQIGRILMWGGQIYSGLKDYEKAFEFYNKGLSVANEINDDFGVAFGYLRLAEYYNKVKDYKKSIASSVKSLEYFEKNNIQNMMIENFDFLAEGYYNIGDFKKSYDIIKKQSILKDSISKKDISSLVSNFEISQEYEKNNLKLELLQKDNDKELAIKNTQFFLLLIVFLGLVIISIILFSRFRIKSKLNKQLEGLNSTKDKFFTIISHDLKTPISSFNNLSGILSDYYNELSEDEKIKHIKSLKDSSSKIMVLLENLLTWSRIQTEKIKASPENLQLADIINNEVQNQKQFSDKKNINIVCKIQPKSYVFADKDMISVVIRNLLSNAIKYSLEDGNIIISTSEDKEFIEIDIVDSGVGIKDEDKTKLFILDIKHSTFGTANEKGTGLGLNLCKEFIERNKGRIWFESKLGFGSTFSFTLPKSE
jgi:signal transduction histidine kinase/Tfp pilus assembly protein PilF